MPVTVAHWRGRPKAVSARCVRNRADQKFAPSCSDTHERLPEELWRRPMIGAIFHEILHDLFTTRRGRALPRYTVGIGTLALLSALLMSQPAMLRLCETRAICCSPACHSLFA